MIRDIILIQKRELESRLKEKYVERSVNSIKLNSSLINVIIGPRRAGKSFFAVHALSRQGIFGYVNFDYEKLVETKDYNEVIDAINTIYITQNTSCLTRSRIWINGNSLSTG